MSGSRIARGLVSVSLAAIAVLPAPAAAQHVDRIVAFGDSYADTGNLFELLGIVPPVPYPTGRFSGGTNYIDTLSDILDVPVDNFAIGGALTNNTNTNSPLLPGFTTEWNAFLTGNTLGGVFPASDGTFDETDLVTVSVGGNDARVYQMGNAGLGILPGALPGATAAAQASAAAATAGLDALVNAGAPTISFLAVDTSLAPEVLAQPDPAAAGAIRHAFSSEFNSRIQQSLAGYAADGVIVHYLDLATVGEAIQADPSVFGLTSAGPCPLAEATRCVTDANFVNQFLFYVDGLHLTSAGFAIVARYVAAQLDAPLTLQAPGDLALDTARQFGRTLTSRVDTNGRDGGHTGLRLFVVGDYFNRDVPVSPTNHKFDIDGVGGTVGAEYGFGNGIVGLAANYTRPRVSFGNDVSEVDSKSWQVGAYGAFGKGGLFAQAYAGYGNDKHRIERVGVIDELRARPDGSHVAAGAKAGYLFPVWKVRAGPIAALDYARAKVDRYTETGDAALTLNVGKQSLKATTGQLGIEGRASFIEGVSSYMTLAAERELSGDSRVISFAHTTAPGIVNQWDVSREKETYGRFTSGMSVNLWEGATLNTTMSRTFGREGGQEMGLQLGFKAGF